MAEFVVEDGLPIGETGSGTVDGKYRSETNSEIAWVAGHAKGSHLKVRWVRIDFDRHFFVYLDAVALRQIVVGRLKQV